MEEHIDKLLSTKSVVVSPALGDGRPNPSAMQIADDVMPIKANSDMQFPFMIHVAILDPHASSSVEIAKTDSAIPCSVEAASLASQGGKKDDENKPPPSPSNRERKNLSLFAGKYSRFREGATASGQDPSVALASGSPPQQAPNENGEMLISRVSSAKELISAESTLRKLRKALREEEKRKCQDLNARREEKLQALAQREREQLEEAQKHAAEREKVRAEQRKAELLEQRLRQDRWRQRAAQVTQSKETLHKQLEERRQLAEQDLLDLTERLRETVLHEKPDEAVSEKVPASERSRQKVSVCSSDHTSPMTTSLDTRKDELQREAAQLQSLLGDLDNELLNDVVAATKLQQKEREEKRHSALAAYNMELTQATLKKKREMKIRNKQLAAEHDLARVRFETAEVEAGEQARLAEQLERKERIDAYAARKKREEENALSMAQAQQEYAEMMERRRVAMMQPIVHVEDDSEDSVFKTA